MYGHKGVGECVENHLLTVIRLLNRRTLAKSSGIGEIRRSIVEIYGGRAGPVNDSEWPMIDHLERCRIRYKGEESCRFVLSSGTAERVIQPCDAGEVTVLLAGWTAIVELADHLIQNLLFRNRDGGLRRGSSCHNQNQDCRQTNVDPPRFSHGDSPCAGRSLFSVQNARHAHLAQPGESGQWSLSQFGIEFG